MHIYIYKYINLNIYKYNPEAYRNNHKRIFSQTWGRQWFLDGT